MSTSILNVWVTRLGDPCSINNDIGPQNPFNWSIAVSHCSGKVLNWSEGRYRFRKDDPWTPIPYQTPPGGTPGWWYEMIPTRDGHVEIEVPPGTYSVRGSMHMWFVDGVLYGNGATDHGIVTACCGADECVMLYAPTMQTCQIILFEFVIPMMIRNKALDPALGRRTLDAMEALIDPSRLSDFDKHELETLRRAFAQMGMHKA